MRLLLDSHVLVWLFTDSPRLTGRARRLIADHRNEVFVSSASVWELALKAGVGRVRLAPNLDQWLPEMIERVPLQTLPVTVDHALAVAGLPRHHGDPFDRLLIAQAQTEQLTIVTADPLFAGYGVRLVEA